MGSDRDPWHTFWNVFGLLRDLLLLLAMFLLLALGAWVAWDTQQHRAAPPGRPCHCWR